MITKERDKGVVGTTLCTKQSGVMTTEDTVSHCELLESQLDGWECSSTSGVGRACVRAPTFWGARVLHGGSLAHAGHVCLAPKILLMFSFGWLSTLHSTASRFSVFFLKA